MTLVSARAYFSVATSLMPFCFEKRRDHVQPAIAVSVGEADEAHRFDAVLRHVIGDRGRHQGIVLRRFEHPFLLLVHRRDDERGAGERDEGRLRLRRDLDERDGGWRDRAADQGIHLVIRDELAGIGDGLGGVAAVIEHDVFDALAGDLLGQKRDRLRLRNAERGARPGLGDDDADLDSGRARRRDQARAHRRGEPDPQKELRPNLSCDPPASSPMGAFVAAPHADASHRHARLSRAPRTCSR